MTGAELALIVNGALAVSSLLLRAQAEHPETPEAERARIRSLADALDAEGALMDQWRPLPPPEAPRG